VNTNIIKNFISHLSLLKERYTESCVSSKRAYNEILQMAETIKAMLFGKKVTPWANKI
jgi:hypothetical protein